MYLIIIITNGIINSCTIIFRMNFKLQYVVFKLAESSLSVFSVNDPCLPFVDRWVGGIKIHKGPVVVRTRLESLCNQHRQSVCPSDKVLILPTIRFF